VYKCNSQDTAVHELVSQLDQQAVVACRTIFKDCCKDGLAITNVICRKGSV